MSKVSLALGFGLLILLAAGSLWIGITATTANLVQAQANATQATTNLVDKCLSGFLFVLVLLAGVGIGVVMIKAQHAFQRLIPASKAPARTWAPGPNARWQKINVPIRAQLPSPQHQPFQQQQVLLVADVEEEDDLPLQGWGF